LEAEACIDLKGDLARETVEATDLEGDLRGDLDDLDGDMETSRASSNMSLIWSLATDSWMLVSSEISGIRWWPYEDEATRLMAVPRLGASLMAQLSPDMAVSGLSLLEAEAAAVAPPVDEDES